MSSLFARHGIRAVLFDFDGTLAEATLDFSHMRRRAAEAVRRHVPVPMRTDVPLMEALDGLCSSLDAATAALAREEAMRAVVEVEVEAASRARLFPFVLPMLQALRAEGTAIGIVTRNCPEAVYRVFPDLDGYADCVLTRKDVSRVKPHPEHIGTALARLGCEPGQSLMVGDHPMDIEAGKRAGTLTAGVASGEASAGRLERAAPRWLAADAGELMRLLGIFWKR